MRLYPKENGMEENKKNNLRANAIKNKEQGITLIALIITVIILVILSAVAIVNLQQSKMIEHAVNGTERYTKAQVGETDEMDALGNKVEGVLENIRNEEGGNGDNPGTDPDNPKPPIPPEEPKPTLMPGWDKEKVYAVISEDKVNLPVPIGFTTSDIAEEKKVEKGFVIKQDGTNNEFVWVPTDSTFGTLYDFSSGTPVEIASSETGYREPDVLVDTTYGDAALVNGKGIDQLKRVVGIEGNTTEEVMNNWRNQLEREYNDMKTSVEAYGGFYIGRYETGDLSQVKTVVAKENTDINMQNWYTIYQRSKTIVQGTNINSSMIWGCQWDATMKWFLSSTDNKVKTYVTNSTGMGNYASTNGDKTIPAGLKDEYRVNNIYDMAGNVYEWTLEAYGTFDRVLRRR